MSIKLKTILLENLSVESETPKLSREQKIKIRETFRKYNVYSESLKFNKLYESIKEISESLELAEKYAMNESKEWMESKMIQEDFKEMAKHSSIMMKEAEKLKESEKIIEKCYKRIGTTLQEYFKIEN